MARDISVILPTYRECENLEPVIERLVKTLEGYDWEAIFVDDDSDDGSQEVLLRLARQNPRVRFIRRVGRRGLASACIEGMCSSAAEILAVMDADLQHDESLLPQMVQILQTSPEVEIVVGTRYADGGSVGQWNRSRHFLSRFATLLEKKLLRTELSDPMSGFFAIRRSVLDKCIHNLAGKGFKILLDIVLSLPERPQIQELPYTFRPRERGQSKLDILVGLEYLYLLVDKLFGGFLPVRFLIYSLVGLSGLFLHLGILGLFYRLLGYPFVQSQIIATVCAMVSNFIFNNIITFRARKLKGIALPLGALLYMAICAIGAIANVQVADYLFQLKVPWWLSGSIGAVVGAVWNYAVSTQIVWTWFRDQFFQRKKR